MPITITIPTQQQLMQMQQDPNSLLAMYNAANQPKQSAWPPSAAATNTPGVVPRGTANSPNVLTQVPSQPTFKPTVTNVTASAPFDWKQIAAPKTPQNDNAWIRATSDMINQINQQAQINANAARIPGGRGLESQSSINIQNALDGQLPADVVNQIGQRAAERGVSTGNPYGANSNADYLKAIGLNSLQLQNTGQDWLTAALGRNPSAPIFDPSKLVITPLQQAEYALAAANFGVNQQQAQFGAYNANALQNLQASMANASNATDADRLTLTSRQQELERQNANAQRQLQSDLANADTQFKRDQLIWQFQQNQLDRDNALRLAQLKASQAAGYGRGAGGGGSSGGGYGGFNPATNWSGGTGITPDAWSQGMTKDQYWGSTKGSDWTPGTYTEPMNPLYGYTQTPGLPNTVPGGSPWEPQPFDTGGLDDILGGGAINDAGMSQEELDWLYNVGG